MIDVLIEDNQDKVTVTSVIKNTIIEVAEAVLEYEECNFDAEISVTLVDNDEICAINKEHRNIDKPTDVLSFPMLEFDDEGNVIDYDFDLDGDLVILGDIVISMEKAQEQSIEYGHSLKREVAFLTAHSMLHLLGYDHIDDEEGEKIMCYKQDAVLKELGITRE